MELRKYWFVITKWAFLIAAVTLAAAVASYAYSRSSPPVYSASTTILVNQAQNPATPDYNSILTSERLTQTYSQLIKTRPILSRAIKDLNLPLSTAALDRLVDVRVIRDTQLIQLSVESGDPVAARDLANTLAKDFIDDNQTQRLGETASSQKVLQQQLSDLGDQIKALDSRLAAVRTATGAQSPEAQQLQSLLSQEQVTYSQLVKAQDDMSLAESRVLDQIRVVEPAETPDIPVRPRVLLNVLLAATAGLIVGVGLAFLLEYLDDTVKSPDDALAITGLTSLGTIMRMPGNDQSSRRLVDELPRHSPLAESYRALRTNVDFARVSQPGQTILVTSSNQSEGKTTTLANLSIVMAETGRTVIAIDTDLRRPMLHHVFDLGNDLGLTNLLLTNEPDLRSAIVPTRISNLRVITSGPIPPNPSELLGSARMERLLERLREEAELIMLDSPPVLAVTDPTILAARVDGVILVVDAGKTRNESLARAKDTLDRAAAHLLGIVMNRVSNRLGGGYYYDYNRYYAKDVDTRVSPNGNTHHRGDQSPAWLRSLRRVVSRH